MTPNQLYEKMDQVANATHYSPTERSEALAALLKIAYDENIPFPVLTTDSGTHPAYFVLDDENPLTIGNRFLICFYEHEKGGFNPERGGYNTARGRYRPEEIAVNPVEGGYERFRKSGYEPVWPRCAERVCPATAVPEQRIQ